MTSSAARLISHYRSLFNSPPPWAFELPPSIPFIGKDYPLAPLRMAVYASAENLSHYVRRPDSMPDFLKDDRVWNRHRAAFEAGSGNHFPRVHIAPVENGCLLCAALFVRGRLDIPSPPTPAGLLETMVVGNVGKFSVNVSTNRDYAGTAEKLRASLPYFEIDLEELKPDVLMLPRTMLRDAGVSETVRKTVPACRVLPVPQFNARVVNIHLRKHAERAAALRRSLAGTQIAQWTGLLRPGDSGDAYRYYAELEDVLEAAEGAARLAETPSR